MARLCAALAALGAFGWAGYTSAVESLPELGIYDGFWMILGAGLAVLLAAPWVWSWRRERSLPVVVAAAVAGCWIPLVVRTSSAPPFPWEWRVCGWRSAS
jgi:drug/metabolite transporter (DMT)-like permease